MESGKLPACGSRNGASPAPQEQHSPIRGRTDHLTHAVGDTLSPTAPEFSGGVSGGSSEQRSLPLCRIRTDRGKSKKRQESRQGLKSPELQGFLALCKGLLFPESSQKLQPMPTGEVRLSEQTL